MPADLILYTIIGIAAILFSFRKRKDILSTHDEMMQDISDED